MDTLFAGSFEMDVTARELIAQVIAAHPDGVSFLRITDAANTVNGRIFLQEGKLVTGAVVLPDLENNYPALKTLLAIKEGSFALMSVCPEDEIKIEQTLNIDLLALLQNIDNLPADPNDLVDYIPLPSVPAATPLQSKLGSLLKSSPGASLPQSPASVKMGASASQPPAPTDEPVRQDESAQMSNHNQDEGEGEADPQPPVDLELKKLLEARFTKSLSAGGEAARSSSNFARSRQFQQGNPLGKPLSLGIGAVALCLIATLLEVLRRNCARR